jgi:chloramphenicol 3-O phosphotransferase
VATVVVLNGTSSSGKTTIACALQDAAPRVLLNFSIDSILSALPVAAIERIVRGDDISDLDYPGLVRGYYACVRELLALGRDLVIDNAITARDRAELLVAAVASHHVVMVGLHCAPEVLAERERMRGDRQLGMAVAQQSHIHSWLSYDVTIDTTHTSAEIAAQEILRVMETGRSEAFERTRAALG